MSVFKNRIHKKSFGLSIPKSHWASLIVTVGCMGYLPKWKDLHFGALTASIATPLALLALGSQQSIAPTLWVLGLSCAASYAALMTLERIGKPSDHDASAIVIDEVAGSALAMLAAPLMLKILGHSDFHAVLGVALMQGWLFRYCDIVKPRPAGRIDRTWHHPFSVVLDDLVAGVYAAVLGIVVAWGCASLF